MKHITQAAIGGYSREVRPPETMPGREAPPVRARASTRLLVLAALGVVLFEAANVYFIMPFPGSQRGGSIDLAYFLHTWRWAFRLALVAALLVGIALAWRATGKRRWMALASVAVAAGVAYMANFRMAADVMFRQPERLVMLPAASSTVEKTRLVVGVEMEGEARAYPIQYIGYHHQVRDSIAGRPVLVTYCTVCRTGRVFEPRVGSLADDFRLVGMDRFNAMFEDGRTKSWWRQANGRAVAGELKGMDLPEVMSRQTTLAVWLSLHPNSLVMQPDSAALRGEKYSKNFDYEKGTSRKRLTGTDTVSWGEKAWVVGITLDDSSRAYDWNQLRRERAINDELNGVPLVVVLASDTASFFAFRRPDAATRIAMRGDSLVAGDRSWALDGRGPGGALQPIPASQEFWHSWRTFQPWTTRH